MMPTNVKANVKHVCLPEVSSKLEIQYIYMKWNEIKWMKYILSNKINNNFR